MPDRPVTYSYSCDHSSHLRQVRCPGCGKGLLVQRHADHDPSLTCRPALGNGLCEVADAATTARLRPWHVCPNEPRCPHAAVIHDVYDDEDEVPRCCAEGCQCGARPGEGPLTREEYAALRRKTATTGQNERN